jgi:7-cyano-7-deazaguanine synthase
MPVGDAKGAVVLLSGGLDSSVVLAAAIADGYDVHALTVEYGQRHNREVEAARAMARHQGVDHKVVRVDLSAFGGSALTDVSTRVPTNTPPEDIGREIPSTYVPARNLVFISVALAWAEALDADVVFIGANAVDYSGYPDCRPEFIEAMQGVVDVGTRRGVEGTTIRIVAPLIDSTKADIVERGVELGVPFEHTWSCYRGRPAACGTCESCVLRLRGFAMAGVVDPLPYEEGTKRVDIDGLDRETELVNDGGSPNGALHDPVDEPPLGSRERPIVAELVEEDAIEDGTGLLRHDGGEG